MADLGRGETAGHKILIPGVVSHCVHLVEHPELVAQRIIRFADVVGRERVMAGTDCGFGTSGAGGRSPSRRGLGEAQGAVEGALIASRKIVGRRDATEIISSSARHPPFWHGQLHARLSRHASGDPQRLGSVLRIVRAGIRLSRTVGGRTATCPTGQYALISRRINRQVMTVFACFRWLTLPALLQSFRPIRLSKH